MKYPNVLPAVQTAPVARPLRDYRREQPADDAVYSVIAALYDYDRTRPLDSRVEAVDGQSSQFSVERVSFRAAYGDERVPAFLLLPTNVAPPYQVVIWYPGANRFNGPGTFQLEGETAWFQFLVRSGRAVFLPEYRGSYERWLGDQLDPHVWREIVLHSGKDIRRAIDYLETRRDIDAGRIAYYGVSMGAATGGIMTAVEPRFKASILLGGGLYPWMRAAEADIFNFLPRVHVPTLMVNGKLDYYFQEESSQTPMFDRLGTREKRHVTYESGHIPTERDQYVGQILDWLDRYLGAVRLR